MLDPEFLHLFCILSQLIRLKLRSLVHQKLIILGWRCNLLLLLQSLVLLETDLCRLLESELGVLAVDALRVNSRCRRLDFKLNFDKILRVDFAGADQSEQEGFVGWVDSVKFKLNQHLLQVHVAA